MARVYVGNYGHGKFCQKIICLVSFYDRSKIPSQIKQELSYRKQIARQLHTIGRGHL